MKPPGPRSEDLRRELADAERQGADQLRLSTLRREIADATAHEAEWARRLERTRRPT